MSDKPAAPITIRAALAADCSDLPRELRHFVHVLALHADYRTGRGLTGQAMLARYMGLSRRQVQRLWARLDALWEAKQSPVVALREARHHTSDAYRLEVAPDALQKLEKLQQHGSDSSAARVDVTSKKVIATSQHINVTPRAGHCDMGGSFTPTQCDMGVSISPQVLSPQTTPEDKKSSTPPSRPDGRGGEAGAAPRSPEARTAELASLQLLPEWQRRPEDDGMSLARRRAGLRKLHQTKGLSNEH